MEKEETDWLKGDDFEHQRLSISSCSSEDIKGQENTNTQRESWSSILISKWGLLTLFEIYMITALLIIFFLGADEHCNLLVKSMILATICIKAILFIPVNICMIWLYKKYIIQTAVSQIVSFLYLPWCIFVLHCYYSNMNNCNTQAHILNIALIILQVEATIYVGIYSVICCLLVILSTLLVYFSIIYNRRMKRDQLRTIRIQEAIREISQFKLSPHHFRTIRAKDLLGMDDCPTYCCLCTEKIESDNELFELPCNQNHIFHNKCISEWLEMCQICPCCKACVRDKINIESSEDISNENNQ